MKISPINNNQKGFTLIEVMVSLLIISVLILGVYSLIVLSIRITADNKNYVEAIEIANQKMEQIRNMPYDDVGVVSGIPVGIITPVESVIRNGNQTPFTAYTYVKYFDDPYDGTAGNGDSIINDYKIATIKIDWESNYGHRDITIFSKIIPKTVEMDAGMGLLKISTVDANGAPVPNANVKTVNTDLGIDVTNITNTEGILYLPVPQALQSYKITVTKPGYGTDYSVDPPGDAILKPVHLSVFTGQQTIESFSIDKLALLNISVYSNNIPANWQINEVLSTTAKTKTRSSRDNFGNLYFSWQDTDLTNSSVYLQKYNSSNVKQWTNDIKVHNTNYQTSPDVVTSKNGTTTVVWQDNSIALKAVAYSPKQIKIATTDSFVSGNTNNKEDGKTNENNLGRAFFAFVGKYVNNAKNIFFSNIKNYHQMFITKIKNYRTSKTAIASGSATIVQTKIGPTGTGNTLTATFDNTPSSGNVIIAIAVLRRSNTSFNPPYNTSGSFTQSVYSNSNYPQDVGIWHKVVGASEPQMVTIQTVSNNVNGGVLMLMEVSGLDVTNLVDVISVNDQNSNTSLTADTGSTLTSVNPGFAVAAIAFADNNFDIPTSANWSSISSASWVQRLWQEWNTTDGSLAVATADISASESQRATLTLNGGWFNAEERNSALVVFRVFNNSNLVGSINTQVPSIIIPNYNQYLGGSFVITTNNNITINSIKIKESGTVDAQSNLDNIKLFYNIDSSAPYDCISESYIGTDPQFGATTTFDGIDGSAIFNEVSGIAIDAVHALCLYPVADIKNSANKDDTIEIEINNPATDVIISPGTMMPATSVAIAGATTLLKPAELQQAHYRFRNDDGDEVNANWNKNENENIIIEKENLIRLRLEISNEGSLPSLPTTYRLEYGEKNTTCEAISTWHEIPNNDSLHWKISESVNINDNDPTTNINGLFDENDNFIPGKIKDSDNLLSAITLSKTDFTELEYAIMATANATENTYCFRLTNSGNPAEFNYIKYPEVSIIGDNNIFIKSFDKDGNVIWGPKRVHLDTSSVNQQNPRIAIAEKLGNSTTTIVWEDYRNGNIDIYAQLFDNDGNRLLTNDLRITDSIENETTPVIAIDSEDNIYIAWIKLGDVYLQKFNLSGTKLWASDKNITNSIENDFSPEISANGNNSINLTWTTIETTNNVYLANFDIDGNELWKTKANKDTDNENQFFSDVFDNNSDIYVSWTDNRSGNNDIYTQKYNFSGMAQWSKDQKINDNTDQTEQNSPTIIISSDSHIFSAWHDERNSGNNIYATYIENPGSLVPRASTTVTITGTRKQNNTPRSFVSDSGGKISLTLEHDNSYQITSPSIITDCQPIACPIPITPGEIRDLDVFIQ